MRYRDAVTGRVRRGRTLGRGAGTAVLTCPVVPRAAPARCESRATTHYYRNIFNLRPAGPFTVLFLLIHAVITVMSIVLRRRVPNAGSLLAVAAQTYATERWSTANIVDPDVTAQFLSTNPGHLAGESVAAQRSDTTESPIGSCRAGGTTLARTNSTGPQYIRHSARQLTIPDPQD